MLDIKFGEGIVAIFLGRNKKTPGTLPGISITGFRNAFIVH
jgi:hypothetical protein